MDCAIFRPVDPESTNYYQLSGPPISDLEPCQALKAPLDGLIATSASKQPAALTTEDRTSCKIVFIRSRMLYAKAALNAKGGIRFGLRHIRQCVP